MLVMKNSASNHLTKQALQTQATQLLPILTAAFLDLNYKEITHQRISHQDIGFQGLTKARHSQFGQVMIKWEITKDAFYNLTEFNDEIKILQALDAFIIKAQNIKAITSPVLEYKNLPITIAEYSYSLTFLTMPYYPKGSLAQYLKQSLSIEQKQQLITQAANLLNNLHSQGWLHNDIKPSNFLIISSLTDDNVDSNPDLLLTDFALAQRIDSTANIDANTETNINAAGTPAYLAPERWQGQTPTQQSDIYAFGIMVYEILTGSRPFKIAKISEDTMLDWATQHCQQFIPKLPNQYQDYQPIIDKSLAKKIENRYKDMTEVIADLYRCSNYKPLLFKS